MFSLGLHSGQQDNKRGNQINESQKALPTQIKLLLLDEVEFVTCHVKTNYHKTTYTCYFCNPDREVTTLCVFLQAVVVLTHVNSRKALAYYKFKNNAHNEQN